MRKAFQTGVSQREPYRIVRYDSASGGVLHAHRDNSTKETAHRRFTMTINLNAGDYEGGALRFREYGDHLYEVERGTAVIWSAALLHEVMPVTRGDRFVLGVHMYGP
jgi:predicted 2-oxoglutarate/Fe(II)-dependent dioxygenase YbiX